MFIDKLFFFCFSIVILHFYGSCDRIRYKTHYYHRNYIIMMVIHIKLQMIFAYFFCFCLFFFLSNLWMLADCWFNRHYSKIFHRSPLLCCYVGNHHLYSVDIIFRSYRSHQEQKKTSNYRIIHIPAIDWKIQCILVLGYMQSSLLKSNSF